MPHDARERVLVVSQNGTAVQAGRIEAVMAGRGDVLLSGYWGMGAWSVERGSVGAFVVRSTLHAPRSDAPRVRGNQQANVAPRFIIIQPVQGMTRAHARLAAGAFVEVNQEGVLLAGARFGQRNEVAIKPF